MRVEKLSGFFFNILLNYLYYAVSRNFLFIPELHPLEIVTSGFQRKRKWVDIVPASACAGTFVDTECIAVVAGSNSKCPSGFAHRFQTVLIVQG